MVRSNSVVLRKGAGGVSSQENNNRSYNNNSYMIGNSSLEVNHINNNANIVKISSYGSLSNNNAYDPESNLRRERSK